MNGNPQIQRGAAAAKQGVLHDRANAYLRELSELQRKYRSVFAAECALRSEIAIIDREIKRQERRTGE